MGFVVKVLKEIGIFVILIVLILGAMYVAFSNSIPYGIVVPESINYTNIDENQYSVRGDVENTTKATEVFQASSTHIKVAEDEIRFVPGKVDPFGPVTNLGTDLPSSSELVKGASGDTSIGTDPIEGGQFGDTESTENNGTDITPIDDSQASMGMPSADTTNTRY